MKYVFSLIDVEVNLWNYILFWDFIKISFYEFLEIISYVYLV